MKNDVVPVQIRGILPANSGCALFVGNDEKVFVINVEPNMGAIIGMFLRDTPKERPLTHDLIQSIFKGFSITVERVVITELKNSTYFARLILQQQNELARKIVEIDARPSDCLALATAQKRPIYVANALFEQVEDMTEVLEQHQRERRGDRIGQCPASVPKHSAPLVLVCGEDEFAVKQRAKQLYVQWTEELGGMDHEIIDGAVSNSGEALKALAKLREAMQTLPFFGTRQGHLAPELQFPQR